LPIVQGGVTKQVSVANLTDGRALSATEVTLSTGNLVIGTSGKGIDFSATPGTGTSELLADYEEGTWTPVVTSGTGSITAVSAAGTYTKIGRLVTLNFFVYMTNNGTGGTSLNIAGAPFASAASQPLTGYNQSTGAACSGAIDVSTITLYNYAALYPIATGQTINCSVTYIV